MKQLFVLILLAALTSAAFGATTPAKTATQSHNAQSLVPIRSPAALQRYLRETPPGKSPFDLLPRGARKRFLGSLKFGRHGLGTLPLADLPTNLTDSQIHQVLKLFGPEALSYAKLLHGRDRSLTPAERNAPESPLELKFDQFYLASAHAVPAKKKSVTLSSYGRLLSRFQQRVKLRQLSDHDLELLYRAAGSAAFWSATSRYLGDMRHDLDELYRRGLADPQRIADYHHQLVAARRFKAANAVAAAYPSAKLKSFPPVHRAGKIASDQPSVMWIGKDGQHLWHQSVNMDVPVRIIVVANCHFSQDAARAISADPVLDKLFQKHAVWLADQNQSLQATRDWNRKFPDQPIHIAWQDSQWSMLNSWNMPTFYVFKHGKLVEEWNGWPSDSAALNTVRTKLQAAGILNKGPKGS